MPQAKNVKNCTLCDFRGWNVLRLSLGKEGFLGQRNLQNNATY